RSPKRPEPTTCVAPETPMGACRSRRLPTWLNALRGEGAGSCCLLPRNSDSRGNLGETTALSAGSRQGVLGGQTVGRGVTRSVRITAGGVEGFVGIAGGHNQ